MKRLPNARFGVVYISKSRSDWADLLVADYSKRLRRHGGVVETRLKPVPFKGDEGAVRLAEARRILGAARGQMIALDERGEDLDTHAFAKLVDQGRSRGRLDFALGGPYGLHSSVRHDAWRVVRLSSLVLNHQLARALLYEQLYRAMTLIDGVPYHH